MRLTDAQREVLSVAVFSSRWRGASRADFTKVRCQYKTIQSLVRKGLAEAPDSLDNGTFVKLDWWRSIVTDQGYRAIGEEPPTDMTPGRV